MLDKIQFVFKTSENIIVKIKFITNHLNLNQVVGKKVLDYKSVLQR